MDDRPVVKNLVWDAWNLQHISKHDVLAGDVEHLLTSDPLVRATYKGRLQLIGPTAGGQIMSVVIGPVPNAPGHYYPFSAPPASRNERRLYAEFRRG